MPAVVRLALLSCVLVASFPGTASADDLPPRCALAEMHLPEIPHGYLAIGVGGGGLGAFRGERSGQGMSWAMQLGYRATRHIHAVFAGDYLSFARYSKQHSQQQAALTLGARVYPLGEQAGRWVGIAARNVYGRIGLGVGHAIRVPYESLDARDIEQGAWGAAATVGAGWAPLKLRGGSLAFEGQRTVVHYGNGARAQWGINLMVSLDVL